METIKDINVANIIFKFNEYKNDLFSYLSKLNLKSSVTILPDDNYKYEKNHTSKLSINFRDDRESLICNEILNIDTNIIETFSAFQYMPIYTVVDGKSQESGKYYLFMKFVSETLDDMYKVDTIKIYSREDSENECLFIGIRKDLNYSCIKVLYESSENSVEYLLTNNDINKLKSFGFKFDL